MNTDRRVESWKQKGKQDSERREKKAATCVKLIWGKGIYNKNGELSTSCETKI